MFIYIDRLKDIPAVLRFKMLNNILIIKISTTRWTSKCIYYINVNSDFPNEKNLKFTMPEKGICEKWKRHLWRKPVMFMCKQETKMCVIHSIGTVVAVHNIIKSQLFKMISELNSLICYVIFCTKNISYRIVFLLPYLPPS